MAPLPSRTLRRLQSEREHRFLLERDEAEALMRLATGHTRLVTYDRARPVAYARTIYLDTPDRSYYESSLRGPVRRRIRVREYAGATDTSAAPVFTSGCFLELKESTGTAREKKRRPITIAEIEQMMADSALQPCLTTWYRRVTLEDAARQIRITMDEGVVYGAPTPFGQIGAAVPPLDVVANGPSRVIEVKLAGQPPSWITAALAGLREDADFSKFRMGMRALEDGPRTDRGSRRTRPISIPMPPVDSDG